MHAHSAEKAKAVVSPTWATRIRTQRNRANKALVYHISLNNRLPACCFRARNFPSMICEKSRLKSHSCWQGCRGCGNPHIDRHMDIQTGIHIRNWRSTCRSPRRILWEWKFPSHGNPGPCRKALACAARLTNASRSPKTSFGRLTCFLKCTSIQ